MKTNTPKTEDGWAIQITRNDKSTFLAPSAIGLYPAVWPKKGRQWAVKHKKELMSRYSQCRYTAYDVVPVHVTQPSIISTANK